MNTLSINRKTKRGSGIVINIANYKIGSSESININAFNKIKTAQYRRLSFGLNGGMIFLITILQTALILIRIYTLRLKVIFLTLDFLLFL